MILSTSKTPPKKLITQMPLSQLKGLNVHIAFGILHITHFILAALVFTTASFHVIYNQVHSLQLLLTFKRKTEKKVITVQLYTPMVKTDIYMKGCPEDIIMYF